MNSIWIAFVIGSAVPVVAMWALDVSTSHRSALLSLGIGALTVLPAALIGLQLEVLLREFRLTTEWHNAAYAFVVGSLVEEAVRYVTIYYAMRHRRGRGVVDVIRVAVWISLGFAILENAVHVTLRAIESPDRVMETALMRATLPTLMHVCCGIVVTAAVLKLFGRFSFVALLGAILFHGLYDWIVLSERGQFEHLILVLIAAWFLCEIVIRTARLRDAEITKKIE